MQCFYYTLLKTIFQSIILVSFNHEVFLEIFLNFQIKDFSSCSFVTDSKAHGWRTLSVFESFEIC